MSALRKKSKKKDKIQSISLRTGKVKPEDANIFQDVNLGDSLDSVPDQIRSALYRHRARVLDVFNQCDDNRNGSISLVEFVKGMRELGLDAPREAVAAVFVSIDTDSSGTIEFNELHNLLVRSVQTHPVLEPLELEAMQVYGLRTAAVKKEDANMLSGLELMYGNADHSTNAIVDGGELGDLSTLPGMIRAALDERHVRVIDLFRQFDDDLSGTITMREFIKSLHDLGLRAPEADVAALFVSIDFDGNGTIEYNELHNLLVRSMQYHPLLEPLDLTAMNAIGLRTAKVVYDDANMFQGFKIDLDALDSVPHQIRAALHQHKARVIDLFRQMDDDASGLIDLPEFKKAMREFGLDPDRYADEVEHVFSTFDANADGSITYLELEKLLRASAARYPRLSARRNAVVNQEAAIASLLAARPSLLSRASFRSFDMSTRSLGDVAESPPSPPRERPQWGGGMRDLLQSRDGTRVRAREMATEVPFTPTTLVTRGGVQFDAFELVNVRAAGANRGSDRVAIVAHPITGAGVLGDRSPLARVAHLALHRHLYRSGYSVLAYEPHRLGMRSDGEGQTGEAQVEMLHAAMAYVGAHRSFRYCKVAVLAQGVAAAAAFVALAREPELFEGRLRVIGACQPAAIDGPEWERLFSEHVPACRVPVFVSHAAIEARDLDESDHEYKVAQSYHAALAEATPKGILEVRGYPLFGTARRFDGAQYMGDFPRGPILRFVDEYIGVPLKPLRKLAPPPPHADDADDAAE